MLVESEISKLSRFLENGFLDCFGEIVFNPIFDHDMVRIKKSVQLENCSLVCYLGVCKFSEIGHK